jgi:hypothetical protein
MRIHVRTMAGLAVLALCSSVAFADDTSSVTTDKLKAAMSPGEFVLTGSDVKTIHDSSTAHQYRVCLKREQGEADLKVMYDDQEARVKLGDCKTVTGKKIEATPSSALTGDERIVATYHREKMRTANADSDTSTSH